MSFLSDLHADLRTTRLTRRRATRNDAPMGEHKEYSRLERIALPEKTLDCSLSEALEARRSAWKCGTEEAFTLLDLGGLFGTLRKRAGTHRRMYPSGGALFPVETYLFARAIEGVDAGIFHYHPSAHALERLAALPEAFEMTDLASKVGWLNPSALLVFTACWDRSAAKYGDLAYQHTLLEAGHMSENILLACSALGFEARPGAGFEDAYIIELLDLDEASEQPVHVITLSRGARNTVQESEAVTDEM